MSNRLLIRPEVQKKTAKKTSNFLPVDLAAAYACYHDNLKEQKELEQKLHIIDLETNQMKRDFRQKREVLERELKQNEKYYWNCHRVFSAATLITESDSYKKRLWTGPQPTKGKLPRRTLDRLSQLVRKLQEEDDLETLWRFQRCARFARRTDARPKTASSSTLSWNGELSPHDLQTLTALMNERTTDSIVSADSNASGKIKRIRSAPSRVASRKTAPADYSKEGHINPLPRQHSPKKPKETYGYLSAKSAEDSDGIDFYTGDREWTPVRLAWAEEKAVAVDDGFEGTDESVRDLNFTEKSCDENLALKQTSKSGIKQSRDDEKLFVTSTLYQTLQSRDTESFDLSSHQTDWRAEPRVEYLKSDQTIPTKDEGAVRSNSPASNVIFSSVLEDKARGDENVDWMQSENMTYGTATSSKGSVPRKIVHAGKKPRKSSVSISKNELENEDLISIAEQKAHNIDPLQSKTNEDFFFRNRAESQCKDSYHEINNDKWVKQSDGKAMVTVGTQRTRTLDLTHKRSTDYRVQQKKSSTVSIALPKTSLHGLSSKRKSLTPRTHHKKPQQQNDGLKTAKDVRRKRSQSRDTSSTTGRQHKDLPDDQRNDERQLNASRKRRVSIFKRKCLSDVLFSGQAQVESQLRSRVQGFLGTIENVGESEKEEIE